MNNTKYRHWDDAIFLPSINCFSRGLSLRLSEFISVNHLYSCVKDYFSFTLLYGIIYGFASYGIAFQFSINRVFRYAFLCHLPYCATPKPTT